MMKISLTLLLTLVLPFISLPHGDAATRPLAETIDAATRPAIDQVDSVMENSSINLEVPASGQVGTKARRQETMHWNSGWVLLSTLTAAPISSSNLASPASALGLAMPAIKNAIGSGGLPQKLDLSHINTNDYNPISKIAEPIALAAMRQSKRRAVHLDQPATGSGIAGAAARQSVTASGKPGPMVRFKQAGDDAKMRRDWNDNYWYGNDYYNGY
ncbi:hypothetical protein CONCODRAFT_6933 [Conidiobolus coronatus NRRL 28638]|uniref:Uncharacterized protein n=1 Tax=Conidiobolus coronatus (strain ATCC 28846 / CBS 209.66 / NRRL 28638) TaxID=796925 RepID=A0A137P681_CONC2|nr:hypothetical protein CONCODRAFT_6933 [Conidiobolus coronatus NRRL 28638]|eukprot:KXN70518.1 hypothetical protein CONCODRAFT_6933 [Conidiobolus coronatus NRRL 28638]